MLGFSNVLKAFTNLFICPEKTQTPSLALYLKSCYFLRGDKFIF